MFPFTLERTHFLFHICLLGGFDFNAGSLSWVAMVVREWTDRKRNLVLPRDAVFQKEVNKISLSAEPSLPELWHYTGAKEGVFELNDLSEQSLCCCQCVRMRGDQHLVLTDKFTFSTPSLMSRDTESFYLDASHSACKQMLPSGPMQMTHINVS